MYRIILQLDLGVTLVGTDRFETEAAAHARIAEKYPTMQGSLDVMSEEELQKLSTRKVGFPEASK